MPTQELQVHNTKRPGMERANSEVEERFHRLLEHTPAAVAMLDYNLCYLLVSRRWRMDYGLGEQELIGHSHYDCFPVLQEAEEQGDRGVTSCVAGDFPISTPVLKRWQQIHQRCLAGASEKCAAESFLGADGTTDWIQWEICPWTNSVGEIGGLMIFTEVITERKAAEAALRQSHQLLGLVMDNIPQAVFWKDQNSVYQGCNQKFLRDSGVDSADQIVGKTDYELGWTQQKADFLCECDTRVLKTNAPESHILESQLSAEGTAACLETNIIPLHDSQGNVVGILGTYEDITTAKHIEAERLRLLNVVEMSLNEIYIFDAETFRFQYVNAGARRNLGYSLEAIQMMTAPDIIIKPELNAATFPQLIAPLLQHEQEKLEFQTIHRRADGSIYPVEVHLQLIEQNGESLFLAVILDITSRKHTELSLRKSESRYRAIIEDQTELICRFFPDGTLTFVNGAYCRYFGKTKEELIGCSFLPVIPEEDQEIVNQHLASLSVENPIVTTEHRVVMLNEEIRWQQWTHRAMFDEQGSFVQFQSVGRDITELKRTEEALKKANEELEMRVEERTNKLKRAIERLKEEITERQQAEEALKDQQKLLQNVIDTNPSLMFVKDWEGKFVLVNQACASAYGTSIAELIGKSDADFNPNLEEVEQYLQADREVMTTLQEKFVPEEAITLPTGELRWVQTIKKPLLSADGTACQLLGVATDITERKQVEEALRRSEVKNRAFLDAIPDLMFRVSKEGIYLDFMTAKEDKMVASNREVVGKSLYEIIPAEIAEELQHRIELTLATGKTAIFEYRMPRNGNLRDYEARLVVSGEDEVLSIVRDITERKQAETALQETSSSLRQQATQLEQTIQELQQTQAQLVQTEKMSSLGQLVAGVAHEINNPVNFIYGNLLHASEYTQDMLNLLQLYQQNYPHPVPEIQEEMEAVDLDFLIEDLPKMLTSMKVGADRIRQIVLSLRNFSRLDEAQMKPVNIHEGLDSTLLILQNRIKARPDYPGIQIVKEYGNLPPINCYAGQMNQVFMNLISNAIDALEQSVVKGQRSAEVDDPQLSMPSIWIRTAICEDRTGILIRIADNGSGMTEEVRQRLFDPFFTTKPVGKGTGLGLSISYQIVVEKHGGQLQCNSTQGRGAEFVIEIPIQQYNSPS